MTLKAMILSASALVAVGLAGCASPKRPADIAVEPLTPTEQYAIQVNQAPEQVALAPHREGLSARQQAALGDFASRWRALGGGDVMVRAPLSGPDGGAARETAEAAGEFLRHLGVPTSNLSVAGYDGGPGAPVVASFVAYQAHGPDCSGNWDNLTSTGANKPFKHFGCAVTANFAAQIANPKDFIDPAPLAAADNSRRAVILGKYRRGETTSSAKDEQASGTVSTVVH